MEPAKTGRSVRYWCIQTFHLSILQLLIHSYFFKLILDADRQNLKKKYYLKVTISNSQKSQINHMAKYSADSGLKKKDGSLGNDFFSLSKAFFELSPLYFWLNDTQNQIVKISKAAAELH